MARFYIEYFPKLVTRYIETDLVLSYGLVYSHLMKIWYKNRCQAEEQASEEPEENTISVDDNEQCVSSLVVTSSIENDEGSVLEAQPEPIQASPQ